LAVAEVRVDIVEDKALDRVNTWVVVFVEAAVSVAAVVAEASLVVVLDIVEDKALDTLVEMEADIVYTSS